MTKAVYNIEERTQFDMLLFACSLSSARSLRGIYRGPHSTAMVGCFSIWMGGWTWGLKCVMTYHHYHFKDTTHSSLYFSRCINWYWTSDVTSSETGLSNRFKYIYFSRATSTWTTICKLTVQFNAFLIVNEIIEIWWYNCRLNLAWSLRNWRLF